MKPVLFFKLFFFLTLFFMITAFTKFLPQIDKDLLGAWSMQKGSMEHVLVIQDGYLSYTVYDKEGKKFNQTRGGAITVNNNELILQVEFNSLLKEEVGKTVTYTYIIKNGSLLVKHNNIEESWKRIDNNAGPLAGTWNITGRMGDGKVNPIVPGVRKTLKILSGSRFQWAAINTQTKEFFGTGGGTYTFENGKYTENIEFFSRDSSRVGASLQFDGSIQNGEWHHSGLSSRGDKIYEVWSKVK